MFADFILAARTVHTKLTAIRLRGIFLNAAATLSVTAQWGLLRVVGSAFGYIAHHRQAGIHTDFVLCESFEEGGD